MDQLSNNLELNELNVKRKSYFKQKVAIFFGYNGAQYHGLQKQIDKMTYIFSNKRIPEHENLISVESQLEKALFDSELIMQSNYGNLKKIGWSRGARTDKGVHAAVNTICCKIIIDKQKYINEESIETKKLQNNQVAQEKRCINWQKIISKINSNLPEDIRVLFIKLVTKTFKVRKHANSRVYEYLAPLSLFIKNAQEEISIEKINNLLSLYIGTNNYHNYTKDAQFKDSKAFRTIYNSQAEIINIENIKMIKIIFKGQSFVYHQIRKMVGNIIEIIQKNLDLDKILQSFKQEKQSIWLAPPHGLLLNRIEFDWYNNKKDIVELLSYNGQEVQIDEQIEKFKQQKIYPYIYQNMSQQINNQNKYKYITKTRFQQWLKEKLEEKQKNNQNQNLEETQNQETTKKIKQQNNIIINDVQIQV